MADPAAASKEQRKDGSGVPVFVAPTPAPAALPAAEPRVWKPYEIGVEKIRGLLDLRDAARSDGNSYAELVKQVTQLSDPEKRAVWAYRDAGNNTFFAGLDTEKANRLAGACINVEVAQRLQPVFSDLKRSLINSGWGLNKAIEETAAAAKTDQFTVRWNFDVIRGEHNIKSYRELVPEQSISAEQRIPGIGSPGFSIFQAAAEKK